MKCTRVVYNLWETVPICPVCFIRSRVNPTPSSSRPCASTFAAFVSSNIFGKALRATQKLFQLICSECTWFDVWRAAFFEDSLLHLKLDLVLQHLFSLHFVCGELPLYCIWVISLWCKNVFKPSMSSALVAHVAFAITIVISDLKNYICMYITHW